MGLAGAFFAGPMRSSASLMVAGFFSTGAGGGAAGVERLLLLELLVAGVELRVFALMLVLEDRVELASRDDVLATGVERLLLVLLLVAVAAGERELVAVAAGERELVERGDSLSQAGCEAAALLRALLDLALDELSEAVAE